MENALKYTPAKSDLVLRASLLNQPQERAVQIEVADRGPGVASENHNRVFEKFFRQKQSDRPTQDGEALDSNHGDSPGVGLGLAICSGIIEAHGGKIWVQDRPGGGAVFKFFLPITGESPMPINPEKSREPILEHKNV